MRVSKMLGERYKERPSDATLDSHALMMRGGYMKQVTSGIFSLYMPTKRMTRKVEEIIRQEMDALDGQEVLFPVVMPASLWEESGRFEAIGSELVRFEDRNGTKMVLGMTHEEAAVQLCRDVANSYTRYPFMIYQIQTKFRDEARARGGLIRVREFTMKDAYSFHTSQEDLEAYYQRCHVAYERIFARAGAPDVVSVCSDSGMMGGKVSHEFMMLCDAGEDTIVVCDHCDYKANMEAAACIIENQDDSPMQPITQIHTPGANTIEGLAKFLDIPEQRTAKAVVYEMDAREGVVLAFIRGDLEINETKLRNHLKSEIFVARPEIAAKYLTPGYIGPVGVGEGVEIVVDASLKGLHNLVTGANKPEYHIKGYCFDRDYPGVEYIDIAKTIEGGKCPQCGQASIRLRRGIEVGNIFQLGTRYTQAMGMQYTDANGDLQTPIMGCYGIGVGRLVGSICEASHDKFGPIWPITIAPWEVHVCALRMDEPGVTEAAERLYTDLMNAGIEVLYDDRGMRPGPAFSDADLLGVPIRVIVSPKNLQNDQVELATRDKRIKTTVSLDAALQRIQELREQLYAQIEESVPERI